MKVECGYDLKFTTVFEGYVMYVKTGVPLEIICEDAMWLFKRIHVNPAAYKGATVKKVVDSVIAQVTQEKVQVLYSFPDFNLGVFRINRGATGLDVFEELKKTYKIYSYFREGILYVGFANKHPDNTKDYRKKVDFFFNETIIEDNLTYRTKDNFFLKIIGNSIIPTGKKKDKKLESRYGESGGQEIQLCFYNLTQAALDAVVKNEYETYKVNGFEGDFLTFGEPYIRQGDAAVLHDHKIPERNGTYEVKQVTRNYGMNGYRQRVELGRRLS